MSSSIGSRRETLIKAPRRLRAYLAATSDRPVLLLAATEEEAARYARDAACFTGEAVVHLPSRGVPYGDVFSPEVRRVGARQRALHALGSARVVTAGPLALMEKTPLYEPLELASGVELDMDEVLRQLAGLGYERVERVFRPGEFAVRGGILDLFPSTRRSPVRVEWWGDEVESVRAVSLATRRAVKELAAVTVYAAREGDLAELAAGEEGLSEEARRGVRVPGLDRLLLNLDPVEPAVLLPEGMEVWAEEPREHIAEGLEGIVEELYGELPAAGLRFSAGDEGDAVFSAPPLAPFAETPREAARRLGGLVEDGMAVFIACGSGSQVRRTVYALGQIGRRVSAVEHARPGLPPGLYAVPGEVEEGFYYSEGGISVVRQDAVLGRRRERRRRTGRPLTSFADLKPGDLVVHAVQGVGRFEGLVSREVLGVTRDYMQVTYRGGDTLLVPYEQMELLHKYVGDGARLDRLGGESWARVTDRVRRRVRMLAGELLRLHAERARARGFAFPPDGEWERELEESFPHQETPDQAAAIAAVKEDMQRPHPMDRLVCGDVGFGKTEVAVRAAFKAALAGKQTLMLAPTTILVQQHYRTFRERLGPFAVRVESLSRFTTAAERRRTLRDLSAGEVDILIGTHALLGAEVRTKDLGLLIVDEEQRFGVRHKERIKQLKSSVDVLTLTATPIPRTMQMGLSGLRDISVIETPPAGRRSILTHVGPYDEDLVRRAIEREVARGGQVFFVHNRVETIEEVAERLRSVVPGVRFAVAHGQMPERVLEEVMQRFLDGEADVLVTTTIVESGLDIATANTLIVERADTMGLAQLYQLRGRIGRSTEQAYAYLFAPLGATPEAQRRLEALLDFTDLGSGFAVAMRDLEIRGAGNLLGAEQSGHIAAVGFEMYLRLLEEAVALERGEEPGRGEERPVIVEVPLDAYLPPEYVSDEIERVDLYRRASAAGSLAEVEDLAEELEERFGPLPEPARNLLGLTRLKILGRRVGASSVGYRSGVLTVYGVTPSEADLAALRRVTGGVVSGREGRVSVRGGALGALELSERVLRVLAGEE
ncbi:Transcription-repair-coupling factor [Rubrobacter xylanophilus DSM 9941]|uniref:transcription-repair coupling factor n=1 Tax=Rubrobacter xylanophilus TaxID=49319 RepID=UPI001C63FC95|nr:transcription-repair coupling factor [Rubrobacter xylanophilus]QYJ17113.1 Transcription-repair-coupling factor [Rubrobacter xylanophilus DSM 9941]